MALCQYFKPVLTEHECIANSIIWENQGNWRGTHDYRSRDIQDRTRESTQTVAIEVDKQVGTNLIDLDPLFAAPNAGNYRLRPGSPAIDVGGLVNAPAQDLDGTPRPVGAGIDIGAYEFDPEYYRDPYDVNGDGRITEIDFEIVRNAALAGSSYAANLDINRDGHVDTRDMQALVERLYPPPALRLRHGGSGHVIMVERTAWLGDVADVGIYFFRAPQEEFAPIGSFNIRIIFDPSTVKPITNSENNRLYMAPRPNEEIWSYRNLNGSAGPTGVVIAGRVDPNSSYDVEDGAIGVPGDSRNPILLARLWFRFIGPPGIWSPIYVTESTVAPGSTGQLAGIKHTVSDGSIARLNPDAAVLQRVINAALHGEAYWYAADTNRDGVIDASEVQTAVNYALGIE